MWEDSRIAPGVGDCDERGGSESGGGSGVDVSGKEKELLRELGVAVYTFVLWAVGDRAEVMCGGTASWNGKLDIFDVMLAGEGRLNGVRRKEKGGW